MSYLKPALATLICLGLGACGITASGPPEKVSYARRPVSFSPTAARDWLNRYRQSQGLSTVSLDPRLTAFAQAQANAMAANNTMSHEIAGSFSSRTRAAGLTGMSVGENISVGTYTDGDAMRQWKNSPGHNQNLLRPEATRFGIAIAQSGGRVYWAMAVASDPEQAHTWPPAGEPTVRVVRRRPPETNSGLGGLFGN
jgi:uncharacterized protein YkwD